MEVWSANGRQDIAVQWIRLHNGYAQEGGRVHQQAPDTQHAYRSQRGHTVVRSGRVGRHTTPMMTSHSGL